MWIGYGICLKISVWSDSSIRVEFTIELSNEETATVITQIWERENAC